MPNMSHLANRERRLPQGTAAHETEELLGGDRATPITGFFPDPEELVDVGLNL